MSWVATAIVGTGLISAKSSKDSAKQASQAATQASGVQADSQAEALAYLRQINALPQHLREQALQGLSDYAQNAPQHQYGTGFSEQDIKQWFQNNPGATDAQIAVAMQKHGISPMQIAAATGTPIQQVEQRFSAQGGQIAPQYTQAQNRQAQTFNLKDQGQLIQDAQGSPLYAAIMGTQQAGEQAILRNQSATGGLRGGGTIGKLTDYGQQTANRALLDSFGVAQESDRYGVNFAQNQDRYGVELAQNQDRFNLLRDDAQRGAVQGQYNYGQEQSGNQFYRQQGIPLGILTGLAGISGNEGSIADLISGIGTTNAQGITASAQANQQGSQNMWNNLMGIAGLGIGAYGGGMIKI